MQPIKNSYDMLMINKMFISICLALMLMPIPVLADGTDAARKCCSGTLPIMIINSDAAIINKEPYVNATCYIDALGQDGYESMGSAEAPIRLQIKGHGNYTWRAFDKKSYRLKFDDKMEPLGMNKNRHFTLLAHADDDLACLRNTVGFELSRLIGMAYTPAQEPVEVILNGDYAGLYMLTEKVRVGKNRVEITEQADLATDPEEITGGWLLEIDNYDEDGQIHLPNSLEEDLKFTVHSPETRSPEQTAYIQTFLEKTDKAVYSNNRSSRVWENYIDMDALARYYIVREILDDAESFRGSCYIHKDRGTDTKLIFGPVWDFGNAFHRGHEQFIWQDPPYGAMWIGKIYKFTRFKEHVMDVWQHFLGTQYPKVDLFIDDFIERISRAYICNMARWPKYYYGPIENRKQMMKQCLAEKVYFLTKEWGEGIVDVGGITSPVMSQDNDPYWYTMEGRRLNARPSAPGLYIHGRRKVIIR